MTTSRSSRRWLKQHFKDPYVIRAQQEGWRSRSAYKLLEIQQKDKIIRRGMTIVDLGAAPGGWSQVAASLVGETGQVFALDILPMHPLTKVTFLQGDFRDASVLEQLIKQVNNQTVNLVISDMSPNLSGTRSIDQPKIMYLSELALDFAQQVLTLNGSFLIKVFQGEGFEAYLKLLRQLFKTVVIRKPPASRHSSAENYLLAKGYTARPLKM